MINILEQGILFGRLCELLNLVNDFNSYGWCKFIDSFCQNGVRYVRTRASLDSNPITIKQRFEIENSSLRYAWSNELLDVCKQMLGDQQPPKPLDPLFYSAPVELHIRSLANDLTGLAATRGQFSRYTLEAILNKYGRSLTEESK